MIDLNTLLRDNIRQLVPYSSARAEYKGESAVFLDANENPYNAPVNRYPDPLQVRLKEKISAVKSIDPACIFLGNGSDEAIDLLIRAFCEPLHDNIVSINPTYGMYKVCADINNIEFRRVLLTPAFKLDAGSLLSSTDDNTKLVFLCSPNNPTSNSFNRNEILTVINRFKGIVILDEAYIDFSSGKGFLHDLAEFPNLVILQTFSKAWGMAGIRLGMAVADRNLISVLNKIKYPYNINVLTLESALKSLKNIGRMKEWVASIINQRKILEKELKALPVIRKVFPSDANFLLVKVSQPREIYRYLVSHKIIIRDRSGVSLCEDCLRITVGTATENTLLIEALKNYREQIT